MSHEHPTQSYFATTDWSDLLIRRATEGLHPEEAQALDRAIAQDPELAREAQRWELAAAAADLAQWDSFRPEPGVADRPPTDPSPGMPPDLRSRVLQQARAHFAQGEPGSTPQRPGPRLSEPPAEGRPSIGWSGLLGWGLAAAMLALAVIGWMGTPGPTEPPRPTLSQRYQQLLQQADTRAVRLTWRSTGADARFAQVAGDVVWSDAQQEGYMRFASLPTNDPAQRQYQLWIVDPDRYRHPVDGGVFNAAANEAQRAGDGPDAPDARDASGPGGEGAFIVPIRAKLPVSEPAAFALTLEQPGGVVVSEGPLLVIAQAQP